MIYNHGIFDGLDGEGSTKNKNIYYRLWSDMLERCYSPKYHKSQPTYVGTVVCDEWKLYSNFKQWAEKHYVTGYDLDKDLLASGNKIYSPETCCFIPRLVNKAISSVNLNNLLPLGVSVHRNKYRSRIRKFGKLKNLGVYVNLLDAHRAWQKEKIQYFDDILVLYHTLPSNIIQKLNEIKNKLETEMNNNIITTSIL